MRSRIKELREKRGIIQAILAAELGITQQMLSKYERDITSIKVDVLKKLDQYDQELVWALLQEIRKTAEKRKRNEKDAEDSHM